MNDTATSENLKKFIRDVSDFPQKGIVFKDITPLLQNPETLKQAVDLFIEKYKGKGITKVVAIDARGFLFATPVAIALNAGVVPVRKKGKLPYKTKEVSYSLEYGTATVAIHEDSITKGEKILVVDDVLATGGTACAAAQLVKQLGGEVVSFAFLIELDFLNGRKKLEGFDIYSLINF